MKEIPPVQPEQEKSEPLKPEDVGFRAITGLDFLSGNKDSLSRIEQMGIDNTAERKGRFEQLLSNIERVAGDRSSINTLKQMAEKIEADDTFAEKTRDVVDFLNFTKSVVANFNDKPALKLVFERGSKDILQESLIIGRGFINMPELSDLGDDVKNAAFSAVELGMMLYAQEHEGRGYQTTEQRKEFEEAKKRSANLKIS